MMTTDSTLHTFLNFQIYGVFAMNSCKNVPVSFSKSVSLSPRVTTQKLLREFLGNFAVGKFIKICEHNSYYSA